VEILLLINNNVALQTIHRIDEVNIWALDQQYILMNYISLLIELRILLALKVQQVWSKQERMSFSKIVHNTVQTGTHYFSKFVQNTEKTMTVYRSTWW